MNHRTAAMHTEEPATHHFLSAESLQEEQLLSQQTLKNSQQLLMSLKIALSNTCLGLWEWNLVSSFLTFDSCSERILGYKPNELSNCKTFEKLIHSHDVSRVIQKRHQYLLGNPTSSYEVEFRILSKSGWKWIIERAVVLLHDHESRACVIGTYQDVTELHSSQSRDVLLQRVTQLINSSDLSELETTLSNIASEIHQCFDTTSVVIHRANGDNTTIASDLELLSSFGSNYTTSDLTSTSFTVPILIHNEATTSGDTTKERIFWGTLSVFDTLDKRTYLQSQINTLKLIALLVSNAVQQAQLIHSLQTQNDARSAVEAQANERLEQIELQNSYLAQIQKQLLKKEKIATLGELIIDLVKEIYNPVEFINDTLFPTSQYAEDLIQLLEHYERCHPIPKGAFPPFLQSLDLNFIKTDFIRLLWSLRAGSEQLQKTVSALHNFSHDDAHTRKTDLNAALSGAITILQHRLKQQPNRPGIEVIKQFGDIPLVECLPGELNQVFISLITNAIEALEERLKYDHSFMPQICINTEIVQSHLSLISSTDVVAIDRQKKVLIHISDNGKGILPHIQRRMFEPFFTTKPFGKGTGLGLAISRQIIEENHRGKLRCNSQLGYGTEFLIEISTKHKHYADLIKRASF